jgi:hypothetical protein
MALAAGLLLWAWQSPPADFSPASLFSLAAGFGVMAVALAAIFAVMFVFSRIARLAGLDLRTLADSYAGPPESLWLNGCKRLLKWLFFFAAFGLFVVVAVTLGDEPAHRARDALAAGWGPGLLIGAALVPVLAAVDATITAVRRRLYQRSQTEAS